MKVEYKVEALDNYTMIISECTGHELDAIRILLKTSTDYSKKAGSPDHFSLNNLLKALMSKE